MYENVNLSHTMQLFFTSNRETSTVDKLLFVTHRAIINAILNVHESVYEVALVKH